MLSADAVREIAEPILREWLGPLGFGRVAVEAGVDHDEDPAFLVTITYRPDQPLAEPSALAKGVIEAGFHLREAMLKQGEDRFPYFEHDFSEHLQAA